MVHMVESVNDRTYEGGKMAQSLKATWLTWFICLVVAGPRCSGRLSGWLGVRS